MKKLGSYDIGKKKLYRREEIFIINSTNLSNILAECCSRLWRHSEWTRSLLSGNLHPEWKRMDDVKKSMSSMRARISVSFVWYPLYLEPHLKYSRCLINTCCIVFEVISASKKTKQSK